MKDNLEKLFKEACPEPCGKSEFTAGVLERIRIGKTSEPRFMVRRNIVGLFCSPIPVILIVSVMLVVCRDRITELLGNGFSLESLPIAVHISSDTFVLVSCCVAVIAIVISCFRELSDDRRPVDWDSLKSNVSLSQGSASGPRLKR